MYETYLKPYQVERDVFASINLPMGNQQRNIVDACSAFKQITTKQRGPLATLPLSVITSPSVRCDLSRTRDSSFRVQTSSLYHSFPIRQSPRHDIKIFNTLSQSYHVILDVDSAMVITNPL